VLVDSQARQPAVPRVLRDGAGRYAAKQGADLRGRQQRLAARGRGTRGHYLLAGRVGPASNKVRAAIEPRR
jgi:hypothetical protein